jgi:hypothetical protein
MSSWLRRVPWLTLSFLAIVWLLGGIAAPSSRPGFSVGSWVERSWEPVAWYQQPLHWLGTRQEGDGVWGQITLVTTINIALCLGLALWRITGRKRPWLSGACAAMTLPVILGLLMFALLRWGYMD